MKERTDSTQDKPLRIFVYGTLKRGYSNHDRFCHGALHIIEATVRGRLYEMPSGIHVLQVPDESIVALGTSDPLADVATQEQILEQLPVGPDYESWDWETIDGELIVFPKATLSLPPIDRLEGFRPESHSLYRRVLVAISVDGGEQTLAWCYVAGDHLDALASPLDKTIWP
jgi:gamma-glutamylcyclotransferase (GGCT)/AIG2-like uncharacterized protein YtfP